ncbi:MAG: flagellar biosynthesis protein FlhB [Bdellovibrionales bacterium]|nr:flagellar biosynthesis protein FlhB [Bdellovibrionales bacterium]
MAEEGGEKTEEATSQRREEFRKRGQVAQSREIATFLLLLGSALTFWATGKMLLHHATDLFENFFSNYIVTAARSGDYSAAALFAVKKGALIIGPLLGMALVVGVSSTLLQVGFVYNEEALQLKLERLNPINGLKRIFSLRAVVDGLKSLLKLILITSIVYFIVKNEVKHISVLVEYNMSQFLSYFGMIAFKLLGAATLFMGVLAVLDYGYQRWELEKEMKMSKQEVKEENKNREGDPLIKARIRRVQREMANKRMMTEVPKADVIVTNPTHIAVALKYQAGMAAPVLIAKGADLIAEKIKKIAKENNIPVIENKPLARAIFKTLKIGQLIPRELFKTVAEVLAYVYRLKKKKRNA